MGILMIISIVMSTGKEINGKNQVGIGREGELAVYHQDTRLFYVGVLQERAIAEAKEALKQAAENPPEEGEEDLLDSELDSQHVSSSTDTPPDTRSVAQ